MSNLGIIHLNNVQAVRNYAATNDSKLLESFVDGVVWVSNNISYQTYKEKIEFVNNNSNYVFDIDVNDRISPCCLLELSNTKLVKFLNPTECDYCAIADQLISDENFSEVFSQKLNNEQILIFTHGRAGTNLLKNSLSEQLNVAPKYLHNDFIDFKTTIDVIAQHQEIVTVFRKDFFEYLTSVSIASQYDTIITKKDNIEWAQQQINNFSPFELTSQHANDALKQFYTFCDILAYLKHLGVNIYYIFYEDLVKVSNNNEVLKNPYCKKDIIINFDSLPKIFYNHNTYYAQILVKVLSKLRYLPKEYLK
jgi:hypothetical protein